MTFEKPFVVFAK